MLNLVVRKVTARLQKVNVLIRLTFNSGCPIFLNPGPRDHKSVTPEVVQLFLLIITVEQSVLALKKYEFY
jgi:hypothetical protein